MSTIPKSTETGGHKAAEVSQPANAVGARSQPGIPQSTDQEMPEKTLKALRGSIKKWEGIVAGTMNDYGEDNCPLCKLFIQKNCRGCPVSAATGKDCCGGSPYRATLRADGHDAYKAAAQAEVDFLKSLLPRDALTALKETP